MRKRSRWSAAVCAKGLLASHWRRVQGHQANHAGQRMHGHSLPFRQFRPSRSSLTRLRRRSCPTPAPTASPRVSAPTSGAEPSTSATIVRRDLTSTCRRSWRTIPHLSRLRRKICLRGSAELHTLQGYPPYGTPGNRDPAESRGTAAGGRVADLNILPSLQPVARVDGPQVQRVARRTPSSLQNSFKPNPNDYGYSTHPPRSALAPDCPRHLSVLQVRVHAGRPSTYIPVGRPCAGRGPAPAERPALAHTSTKRSSLSSCSRRPSNSQAFADCLGLGQCRPDPRTPPQSHHQGRQPLRSDCQHRLANQIPCRPGFAIHQVTTSVARPHGGCPRLSSIPE